MLDILAHKHILKICNTYYLSIATMAARTRLNVTFTHTLLVLLIFAKNLPL